MKIQAGDRQEGESGREDAMVVMAVVSVAQGLSK